MQNLLESIKKKNHYLYLAKRRDASKIKNSCYLLQNSFFIHSFGISYITFLRWMYLQELVLHTSQKNQNQPNNRKWGLKTLQCGKNHLFPRSNKYNSRICSLYDTVTLMFCVVLFYFLFNCSCASVRVWAYLAMLRWDLFCLEAMSCYYKTEMLNM